MTARRPQTWSFRSEFDEQLDWSPIRERLRVRQVAQRLRRLALCSHGAFAAELYRFSERVSGNHPRPSVLDGPRAPGREGDLAARASIGLGDEVPLGRVVSAQHDLASERTGGETL